MGNPDGWIVTLMNSVVLTETTNDVELSTYLTRKKKKQSWENKLGDEKNSFYLWLVQDGAIKTNDSAYLFIGIKSSRSDRLLMERFYKCFLIYIYTVRLENSP